MGDKAAALVRDHSITVPFRLGVRSRVTSSSELVVSSRVTPNFGSTTRVTDDCEGVLVHG